MHRKLLQLQVIAILSLLLASSSVNAYARKKIPDHLMKRFPLVDPTAKEKPRHNIKVHELVAPVIDPHKRKTELDVPREPEHTIHLEDMHEDDHAQHEQHMTAARREHQYAIKKRDRVDRVERERVAKANGTEHSLLAGDPSIPEVHDPTRLRKPTLAPTKEHLRDMVVSVYIRDQWSGVEDENESREHWMHSAAATLDAEFHDHNILFQAINVPADDHLQILCNDPEEREHIKHLLIRLQTVLCFFMEGKIVFGKWPSEGEKEMWKGNREYERRERQKAEKERIKRAKKAERLSYQQNAVEAEKTDL